MTIHKEQVEGIPPRFAELEIDTDMPEYVDFYVDDWGKTPCASISINRDQVKRIRDELSSWLDGSH